MPTCRACGNDNPEGSRFCNGCGRGLETDAAPATDERKIVSVLFCDLVGSTALGERMDPEDIRAVVRPYFELLRQDIESFGGTVEKFIGDAVMAVFGAPRSHEDDPERAVRAGLRILEAIEEAGGHRRPWKQTGPVSAERPGRRRSCACRAQPLVYRPTKSSLNVGSSRIGSRSESSFADARNSSDISIACLR